MRRSSSRKETVDLSPSRVSNTWVAMSRYAPSISSQDMPWRKLRPSISARSPPDFQRRTQLRTVLGLQPALSRSPAPARGGLRLSWLRSWAMAWHRRVSEMPKLGPKG